MKMNLPDSWSWKKVRQVAEVVSGATPRRDVPAYWNGDVPWITPKEIGGLEDPIVTRTEECITEEGYQSASCQMLPIGTVLLSSRAPIGHLAITGLPVCTNQGFKNLVPKKGTYSKYLYWAVRARKQDLVDLGRGATFKEVSKAIVEEFELPFPSDEDEQKRIAAVLDKADALRRKRQEALRLTDDFLRSTFLDLFGDPEKHGWQMETVEDMLAARPNAIRTGPFGSQLLHSEFVDSGIAVLGIDNAVQNEFRWGKPRFISEEKYEQLRRYTVHPGDVIITIMGTVGRCAIVPADIPTAINTKHLCCLTLDRSKCLPEFLHTYFLTHPIARRYLGQSAKGAIMDGLNMGLIKALPVPQVPLHLQQRFSDIAKQVQKTALRSSKATEEAETLFSALQQRAFSGDL